MSTTTICIFGTGAIGSLLGARLALAGEAVTLVGRGPHFAAIRERGVRLVTKDGETAIRPACVDDPARLGPQDVVILCVKAPAVPAAAAAMAPLRGARTIIVSAANGVPWWYFHGHEGALAGHRLASVDPDGSLWRLLPPERALGCIVNAASEVIEPGVVRASWRDLRLGAPGGGLATEAGALAQALRDAGLSAAVSADIRREVWTKLWGNLAFNPLSVLTGAVLSRLAQEPDSREVARRMMREAQEVGERLGIHFLGTVEQRIEAAGAIGAHKTSMLQDFERGRAIELDAVLGAVIEMARLVEVATPICDLIFGLVRQRARVAGCYPE